jgi:hypothetical protein
LGAYSAAVAADMTSSCFRLSKAYWSAASKSLGVLPTTGNSPMHFYLKKLILFFSS